MVFTDVDFAKTATVEAFEPDGSSLGPVAAPAANNGLSFVGLEAPAGERIVRVRITMAVKSARIARAGDLTLASRALKAGSGTRSLKLKPSRPLLARAPARFALRLVLVARNEAGNRRTVTKKARGPRLSGAHAAGRLAAASRQRAPPIATVARWAMSREERPANMP